MQNCDELKNKFQALGINIQDKNSLQKLEYVKILPILCELYEQDKLTLDTIYLDLNINKDRFLRDFAVFKGFEFQALKEYNPYFLSKLSLKQMKECQCLVFQEDENFIYLAFAKIPSNELLDKLQASFKHKFIKIFLANPSKIENFIEKYSLECEINDLIAELKIELTHSDKKDKSAVAKLFELICLQAIKLRASDIHFEPSSEEALIRFRIDGLLGVFLRVELEIYHALILYIKLLAHLNIAETRKAQDGSFVMEFEGLEYDFRLSSLPLLYAESLVLRILKRKQKFLSLENLEFEAKSLQLFCQSIQLPFGMILVTGPTGSGKSTTLYAAMSEIQNENKKIISVEDPVEYRLSLVQQILLNPKAGLDFNNALRAILRQDPDVIMIGEMRDEQSLDIAVKSALTGHLVFSTLHTNDAVSAISRMLDMKAKPYLLASALTLIIAQRLVRKLCKHCKEKVSIEFEGVKEEFFEARGCEYCRQSGFVGREVVAEFLFIDTNLAEMIRENKSKNELLAYARKQGFKTMFELGLAKVRLGVTSLQELLRVLR
ncbi:type II/IV secretion system protein [Campylobacter sp. MIT 12-5580]|uniref:GspE/PulE family protein n=1 Tax=Campylobacter sp. MIT 12-5580 TaxID=2040651 RepID=UPI0010F6C058|nr:GspE/PulE family protein [Campylobacter sp. MIT 12-5580]TKX30238.1 type II/IV secretion system protein [Campylobacter sp. MIT 12-5580]